MLVILSVVLIVAGVSIFDYLTARRWQQVTSSNRNDIVFENRNKEYGAFALRRDYDKRMVLIMLGVVGTIAITFGTYWYIKNLPEEVIEQPKVDTTNIAIPAPPEEELPPPPKEELPPPEERTIAFPPPVIVDIPVEDEIPPQEEMVDTKASTETHETDEEGFGTATGPEEKKPEVIEVKEEAILDFVDEDAQFPGGQAAMNAYIQKKFVYPQTAIELGLQGKCYIAFTVNSDGSIVNVRVERGVPDCPECDKEAVRVVKSMPNWKAAKFNGKVVRSTFRLPINVVLN